MPETLTLVSHVLCPYVQRAAIVLLEKGAPFDRVWVDLADKPGWFTAMSPLGKTPVLVVDQEPIFESAAICEYLDEKLPPRLHPDGALQRARHRGWMEFGSSVLSTVGGFYAARDAATLQAQREQLLQRFGQLEAVVDTQGPWFAGDRFTLVDAVFAPVFRYFDTLEAVGEGGWFVATPRLRSWRAALAQQPSVHRAVLPDYSQRLREFLLARDGELSRRVAGREALPEFRA